MPLLVLLLSISPFTENNKPLFKRIIILLGALEAQCGDHLALTLKNNKKLNYDFARNRRPSDGMLEEWKLTTCEGLEANT